MIKSLVIETALLGVSISVCLAVVSALVNAMGA